jgi:hypothetical protein
MWSLSRLVAFGRGSMYSVKGYVTRHFERKSKLLHRNRGLPSLLSSGTFCDLSKVQEKMRLRTQRTCLGRLSAPLSHAATKPAFPCPGCNNPLQSLNCQSDHDSRARVSGTWASMRRRSRSWRMGARNWCVNPFSGSRTGQSNNPAVPQQAFYPVIYA